MREKEGERASVCEREREQAASEENLNKAKKFFSPKEYAGREQQAMTRDGRKRGRAGRGRGSWGRQGRRGSMRSELRAERSRCSQTRSSDATQARRAGRAVRAEGRRREAGGRQAGGRRKAGKEGSKQAGLRSARRPEEVRLLCQVDMAASFFLLFFMPFVLSADQPPLCSSVPRKVTLTGTCITNNNISGRGRSPARQRVVGGVLG